MVPTWLSRILESLPGHPIWHVRALMLVVFGFDALDNVLIASKIAVPYLFVFPLSMALLVFVIKLDMNLYQKEIVDLRDWLVIRAVTSAYWVSLGLWTSARLVNGLNSLWDYLVLIMAPLILIPNGIRLMRVNIEGKDLQHWGVIKLIKRRDFETDD